MLLINFQEIPLAVQDPQPMSVSLCKLKDLSIEQMNLCFDESNLCLIIIGVFTNIRMIESIRPIVWAARKENLCYLFGSDMGHP